MREVTEDEFFDFIGPRDIVTSAQGSSRGEHGIWILFKTRSGVEVGRIYDKPQKQYLLKE